MESFESNIANYFKELRTLLASIDIVAIDKIVQVLQQTQTNNSAVFLAGNGGSAATATHWSNDLAKMTRNNGLPRMRPISLSDNTSWFTALANDEGYEHVFSGQLENLARKNDVLIVISASGNSSNLINAVIYAKNRGVKTLGLLGFDGGQLKNLLDEYVLIPTAKGAYQLVEDCHSALCHVITTCLSQKVGVLVKENIKENAVVLATAVGA